MTSRLVLVVISIGEPWSTGQKKFDVNLGEEVESSRRRVPASIGRMSRLDGLQAHYIDVLTLIGSEIIYERGELLQKKG